MFKNKNFWVGFFVGLAVFVLLGEVQRSSNRSSALEDLNSNYSKTANVAEKNALIIQADAIVGQNQSWFNFSNSSAGAPSRGGEEKSDEGDVYTNEGPTGVSTEWVIYKDGQWIAGGSEGGDDEGGN